MAEEGSILGGWKAAEERDQGRRQRIGRKIFEQGNLVVRVAKNVVDRGAKRMKKMFAPGRHAHLFQGNRQRRFPQE